MNFTLIQIDGFANKPKEDKNQTRISRFFFFPCGRRNVKKGEGNNHLFLEICSKIQNTMKTFTVFAVIKLILHLLMLLIMLLSARSRELSHKGLACVKFFIKKYSVDYLL